MKSDTGYIYCLLDVFLLSPNIFIVGRKVSEMHQLISFPRLSSIPYSFFISTTVRPTTYPPPLLKVLSATENVFKPRINYELFVVFLMRGYETQILDEDFKLYCNDLISLFTQKTREKNDFPKFDLNSISFYTATANP